MKKALLVARIGKFFSDFEISDIKILQSMGYEVWCAGNYDFDNHRLDDLGIKKVDFDFVRNPLSLGNFKEMKRLSEMMKQEDFALMHCHMPIGGVMARLAAKRAGLKPVLYTAHGLQFCQGGPKRDWLLFYPVEKYLSRYTDVILTMNAEDYDLAKKRFHSRRVEYIPGVGVDTKKFAEANNQRDALCSELNLPEDSFLMLAVGELSKRKNHEVAIRGLQQLLGTSPEYDKMHLVIVGIGPLEEYIHALPGELGIEDHVHFLGWRDDIKELNHSVDCFVFPSIREGLPVALEEAMAAGLPVIASIARGNTELVDENENGYLVPYNEPEAFAKAMKAMFHKSPEERLKMGQMSQEKIKPYDLSLVQERMRDIYKAVSS